MGRARGANALLYAAFESTYGTPPGSGFLSLPFVSHGMGEEQNLIASDLLGMGRDPQDPVFDVINNDGDIVVPVDERAFGNWLKLMFGDPTSVAGVKASGLITFSANPANNSTVTIDGTVFTFVSGTPATAFEVKIGASLAVTLASLVRALNASADTNVDDATYTLNTDGNKVAVEFDVIGTGGNAFTLAASSSPASHATVSAGTLAGGATSGGYIHTFVSGAVTLPSMALEIGHPEVPSYGMNFGCMADKMSLQGQRGGLFNSTVGLYAQGETLNTSSQAGSPTEVDVVRFTQFSGAVLADGVPVGNLVSHTTNLENGLDKIEVIRPDGRIAGADPGGFKDSGQVVVRFGDTYLLDLATAKTPLELRRTWSNGAGKSLTLISHRVFLPRPKFPIQGPGGIQATFQYQAAEHPDLNKTFTAILANDVADY